MKSIFILFFFINSKALAIFDLSVGAQGRSYPGIGGEATLTAGLNIPLWGDVEKGKINYGLLRLQSQFASSVVVYNQDHSVTLYPISFIGFGAGQRKMTSKFEDFVFFNCEQIRCIGDLKKDYSFGKMILGWGRMIGAFIYRESRNTYNDPEGDGKPVGEYQFVSIVNASEETSTHRTYFLGLKLGSDLIGIQSRNVQFHGADKEFNLHFLFYNLKSGSTSFSLGAGNLYSTDQKPSPTAVMNLTFSIWDNKALF